jgi:hypothetical protein
MERFNGLAHSVWDCKYHIVWIPKYRRKELYGAKRRIVVDTIKQWARIKGIEIIEGHALGVSFNSLYDYGVNSTKIRIVSTFRPSSLIAFLPSSDCRNSRNFAMSGISAITPVAFGFSGSRKFRHLTPSFPNISCLLPGPFFQALAQTAPS